MCAPASGAPSGEVPARPNAHVPKRDPRPDRPVVRRVSPRLVVDDPSLWLSAYGFRGFRDFRQVCHSAARRLL
jgi:hypothetical protein